MEKFLYIAGSKGSGKNLIRGLLDGHQQLFVSIFHERIFESFFKNDYRLLQKQAFYEYNTDSLKKKKIEEIRELLSVNGHYSEIERTYWTKEYIIHVASNIYKSININFDFYLFDKLWVKDLYKNGTRWTSHEVCKAIYRSLSRTITSPFLKKTSNKKYYCALSSGYSSGILEFANQFPNSKIIYMKRDPIDIVSALVNRVKSEQDQKSHWWTRKRLFKKWASLDFIKTIVQLDKNAEKLAKKYPKKILIIKFSDMFKNLNKETMRIKKFLRLSDDIALQNFSYAGHKIVDSEGNSYLTTQVDKEHKGLSNIEIKKLKLYLSKALN